MNQYIVTVRNSAGRTSQVPTLADSNAAAQAKVERHWIETDSRGMEVVAVTFNCVVS